MTIHTDEINEHEIMFTIANLRNMEHANEQSITKSLLRIPSTQANMSTKFLSNRLRVMDHNRLSPEKYKKHTTEGLILSKRMIANRLKLSQREATDIQYFIEEEIYLVKKTQRNNLSVFRIQNEDYQLDLIKDLEMINENNFNQTISRFDEFESNQGEFSDIFHVSGNSL